MVLVVMVVIGGNCMVICENMSSKNHGSEISLFSFRKKYDLFFVFTYFRNK